MIYGTFLLKGGSSERLNYMIKTVKKGVSGSSEMSQSGSFYPILNLTDTLNSINISIQKGDRLSISLKIYSNKKIIANRKLEKTFK